MQKNKPKVSVIMITYNGEKYIAEAIDSILRQTMKDFELVIIDDGSVDKTANIIKKYNDHRIRFFQNEKNEGITFSRNLTIKESIAPYIAILDSDDIAMPNRLKIQTDFMDRHPDFGFIGSWVSLINENGKPLYINWKNPLPPEMIPCILLFQNYFNNSSIIIRREALPQGEIYRDVSPAEDYDLWLRINKKWKMWNIPYLLVKYRIHSKNISTLQSQKRKWAVNKIITDALAKLEIKPSEDELKVHLTNGTYSGENVLEFIDKKERWLKKLQSQNDHLKYYNTDIFKKVLAEIWLANCDNNARAGIIIWKKFWKSEFAIPLDKRKNSIKIFIFLIKCILKKDKLSLRNIFKSILSGLGVKNFAKKVLKL
jgi:glycosyltransferase involved in cell wall biosynthesis